MTRRPDPRQRDLIQSAELVTIDRRTLLELALDRVEADLALYTLAQKIFAMPGESATKSRDQLAGPRWLRCSPRKAETVANKAEHLGLVTITENRYQTGAQAPNTYSLNWDGIRAIIHARQAEPTEGHSATEGAGPADELDVDQAADEAQLDGPAERKICAPPRKICAPPRRICPHTKEDNSLITHLEESGTGPEAGAGPQGAETLLAARLVDSSPILTAARCNRVAPLEARGLAHGIWAPLNEAHFNESAETYRRHALVEWFRRQLSTAAPATADTEEALLLTIAAGLYAARLPVGRVKSNRVALFINTLHRRKWANVLPYVPEARRLLDQALTSDPFIIPAPQLAGAAAGLD